MNTTCTVCGGENLFHARDCTLPVHRIIAMYDEDLAALRETDKAVSAECIDLDIDPSGSNPEIALIEAARERAVTRLAEIEMAADEEPEQEPDIAVETDRLSDKIANQIQAVLLPGPAKQPNGDYFRVPTSQTTRTVVGLIPLHQIYRRGDLVGTIEGEPGARQWVQMTNERMRHMVDDHARLQKCVVKKAPKPGEPDVVYVDVPCTQDMAGLILDAALHDRRIRVLDRITRCPTFLPDWTVTPRGYERGVFYDEPVELVDFDPHCEDDLIEEMTVDFPFVSAADQHNLLGLIVTYMVRACIEGNVPMHLVASSLERTGKTKLIEDVVGCLLLGEPTPALQFGGTDEERDKRIFAALRRGRTLMHLDNLREVMDSAALASLITSATYSGRILGQSTLVDLPNTLILVASGNNVRATGEIVKRTVPIVLQPRTSHPELRTDFRHPDLRAWIMANRKRLLEGLVWRIQRWVEAGRPMSAQPFGGFEAWARTVGGIVGGEWMQNVAGWRTKSNPQAEEMLMFVDKWYEAYGITHKQPKDLLALADSLDLFGAVTSRPTTERGRLTAFGISVLTRHRDTPVGSYILRKVVMTGVVCWRLELAS